MAMQPILELFNLTGKGAVVTGGARGIGQGIALRLAEAGAGVTVTDIDIDGASDTARQIQAKGGKAQAVSADACNVNDALRVARITVEVFGSIDILVNNAGIFPFSPALDTSEGTWDKTLDTNLKGVFFYSQAAAREMIKAGRGGKIINISSIDGLHPAVELAHYSASKGGVIMLTKALALELAPHNILVNAIAPGNITTPGTRIVMNSSLSSGRLTKKQMKEFFEAHVPLRRMGDPDDVAKVVLFLASSAADYVTGSLILVDGGLLLT